MKNKQNWIISLFLLAIPYLFFFRPVFGGKTFIGTDIQTFFYPFKYIAAQMYRTGHFFLWDPYLFSGMPTGAEIQTALFYPINLIFAVMPVLSAMANFIAIHLFLTSLFMYLYLREIKLSKPVSLFGALAFTYSGYFLMHVDQLSILGTSTWLPLIFLLIERSMKERGVLYPSLAAAAFSMQFLGGHIQISAIICIAVALYILFKAYRPLLERDLKAVVRIAGIGLATVLLGAALSSIALLPFFDAYSHSLRSADDYNGSSMVYVSPTELQTFLVPELREKGAEARMFGGTGETYAGVIPIFLAIFSAVFIRSELPIFYSILAGFAFFASMGKAGPLHFFLYHMIPFYGALQIPIRLMFLFTFATSTLSAMAMDHFRENASGLPRYSKWMLYLFSGLSLLMALFLLFPGLRDLLTDSTEGGLTAPLKFLLIFGLFAAAMYLFAKKKIKFNVFASALIVFMLFDLLSFGAKYFKLGDRSIVESKPGFVGFLDQDKDFFRVSIGDQNMSPNLPMVYRMQSISGYSPVILEDYIFYQTYNGSHSLDFSSIPRGARFYVPPYLDSRMTGLLNVKYHIYPMIKDGMYYTGIVAMKNYYPRAFMVSQFEVLGDRDQILVRLGDENFEPYNKLFLETNDIPSAYKFEAGTKGSAEVAMYSPDRIDIRTKSDGDMFLFLSEIYYPGWKAYVDGSESKIFRANYLFRAIPLKAGEHAVSFVYDPVSFRIGKYISLASLLLCLGLVGYGLFGRRR